MSVSNFGSLTVLFLFCLLLSIVFSALNAYNSLYRDLKSLQKYLVLFENILTWPDFLFSILFFGQIVNIATYDWKLFHKNGPLLFLVTHIFTKRSQIVCLIHTHILIYWHVRCNYHKCHKCFITIFQSFSTFEGSTVTNFKSNMWCWIDSRFFCVWFISRRIQKR